MIEIALDCIKRGWHVFPCRPKTKEPAVMGGFHRATVDENQIREWWQRWPDANVGIATGASGLTVLDIDHGLGSVSELSNFVLPTYTVRTGRKDGLGVQLYYRGGDLKSIPWEYEELSGDIRSATGYVMAAGSIHPSGGVYEVVDGSTVASTPAFVRDLRSAAKTAATDDGLPITEHRNSTLTSIAGKLRNAGLSAAALESALLQVNADRCEPPLPEAEVQRIAANASRWELPAVEPEILLGKPKPEKPVLERWQDRYHTFDQLDKAPPITFYIDHFLAENGVTAIAAPVGQRKSIIAFNMMRALLTGEKLFDYFEVLKKPERVLYLCPEMGIQSFASRLRKMDLLKYVGETLFCTTMNSEPGTLDELTDEELQGSVVFLDTAIRFLEGDENSSNDMRIFAAEVFGLIKRGAGSVIMIHHSAKGTKEAQELNLENAMRGSGELGAFVACCWATRLQDPNDEYNTPSYLKNVKKRDFQSEPFEVGEDGGSGILRMIGVPGQAKLATKSTANRDGKEEAAIAILKANLDKTVRQLVQILKEHGIDRGRTWVAEKLAMLKGSGASKGEV